MSGEGMKAQVIRLIDVFALGPFMVYSARYLPKKYREVMAISGILTIVYNGKNYLEKKNGGIDSRR